MAAALRAVAPLHGLRLVPHRARIDPAGAGDAGSPALTGASQASRRRARAVLHRADSGEAAPAHLLTDPRAGEAPAIILRQSDRSCGLERRPEVARLRIGLAFPAGAPAGIRLAREQELRKALGAAEGVTVLEQRQDRCRLELRGAVHQRMVTRGEDRELAICVRNLEPRAEIGRASCRERVSIDV